MRIALSVLLGLVTSVVSAQTVSSPITTPQKDAQSQIALQRGVDAAGGASAVAAADNCTAEGTLVSDADKVALKFVWKNSGEEFRYEIYRPTGTQVIVSNHNDPVWIHGARQTKLYYHSL